MKSLDLSDKNVSIVKGELPAYTQLSQSLSGLAEYMYMFPVVLLIHS